jgi:GNAT superfamily N-acetyltransferase
MRPGTEFGSFWHNLPEITNAARDDGLFVVLNSRNQVVGYMAVGRRLGPEYMESGILPLDIFEVLKNFRSRGKGKYMVELLKEAAVSTGYNGIRLRPANNSIGFWEAMGFSDNRDGWLMCPL